MNHSEIESFFNHHCRIKLRSGKEVYGVLWQDLSETDRAIYFASHIAHKKMLAKQKNDSVTEIPLRLELEDILGVEPIEP